MTSGTEERSLGNLEGRMAEQSVLLHQLHADLQQLRADLTIGLQQLRADLTSGLQHVNARIDRLMLAMLAIGGGLLAGLIGIIAALVVR